MAKNVPKIRFKGFVDDWEQRKLGDVAEDFEYGLNASAKEYDGRNKYLRITDIDENNHLFKQDALTTPDTDLNNAENFKLQIGDVLFARTGASVGKTYRYNFNDGTVYFAGFLIRGRFKETVCSEFIYQNTLTNRYKKYIKIMSQRSGQPGVNAQEYANFSLNIPGKDEQIKVSSFTGMIDNLIILHQRKLNLLENQKKSLLRNLFPKKGEAKPELRFANFTDDWEQRKLGDEFEKVNERNDGTFGKDKWISVAKMYFQDPEKVTSNNIDTRTYVMRFGDIAFEGHPNSEYKFGRFVANTIGDGVVSELFPIYRHTQIYDNQYWKYAIHLENIMAPIFAKSITSSGNSANKVDTKHLLRQPIFVPNIKEQSSIGSLFKSLDNLIILHQRKIDLLEEQKRGLLQEMFV